jgi:hypothetical protein
MTGETSTEPSAALAKSVKSDKNKQIQQQRRAALSANNLNNLLSASNESNIITGYNNSKLFKLIADNL